MLKLLLKQREPILLEQENAGPNFGKSTTYVKTVICSDKSRELWIAPRVVFNYAGNVSGRQLNSIWLPSVSLFLVLFGTRRCTAGNHLVHDVQLVSEAIQDLGARILSTTRPLSISMEKAVT